MAANEIILKVLPLLDIQQNQPQDLATTLKLQGQEDNSMHPHHEATSNRPAQNSSYML
jgi:hypothetical protein